MDEWDEFLSRATGSVVSNNTEHFDTEEDKNVQMGQNKGDLGDFGDNAEVLMQMSRGESLSNLLSPNGIWINSTSETIKKPPLSASSSGYESKKRSLKNATVSATCSVPVANSIQDLTRALTGHPLLSHPLSLLKNGSLQEIDSSLVEIDSLGLFFYGTPGNFKIESNVRDDMMKVIDLKRNLLLKSIVSELLPGHQRNQRTFNDFLEAQMIISHENLKILSGSIPPNGKTNWLIPFTVSSSGRVDLSSETGWQTFPDPLGYFYNYCGRVVSESITGLIEPTEHVITLEDKKILVLTTDPVYNISINFRGALHNDPSTDPINFLFYRQSNYSVEIDFESLKISTIKSFVPKFDQQSRVFFLLKALEAKLTGLAEGKYFLKHVANTPFIKIMKFEQIKL